MMNTIPAPLACNLAALSPVQREHYETQKKRLRDAIREIESLPHGYSFRFDSESDLLVAIAQFIEGERHCCAFYAFHLEVEPQNGTIWLTITGPDGTKEFIKEALTD